MPYKDKRARSSYTRAWFKRNSSYQRIRRRLIRSGKWIIKPKTP